MSEQSDKINQLLASLRKAISDQLASGYKTMVFPSGGSLSVEADGKMQSLPHIKISPSIWEVFARHVIGETMGKDLMDISLEQIKAHLGCTIAYQITVSENSVSVIKNFTAHFFEDPVQKNMHLKLRLKEETKIGDAAQAMDPSALASSSEIARWLDQFCSDLLKLDHPKVKDIVFHPTKKNPYVSTTAGSFFPVNHTILNQSKKFTDRVAQIILESCKNKKLDAIFKENGESFDSLDLDMTYQTEAGVRFRVNIADVFSDTGQRGCAVTMKVLPERPLEIDSLKLPRLVKDSLNILKSGLVLVCGNSGCGKSTTLSSMIDSILRTRSINLMTVESPMETIFPALEYSVSLISQREVGKHALSFEEAAESLPKQSLNAVFLGDIRSYETARSALSLAQSGFLVLGNLQCQNIHASIDKMIDFFPGTEQGKARIALASQYRLGIAQALAPGIDENLRLAVEVMKSNPDIKAYITQTQKDDRKFSVTEIIEKFSEQLGTQSLDQSLAGYFMNKEITEDTLMEYSPDPEAVIVRQELLKIKLSAKWDPAGATIEKAFGRQLQLVPLHEDKE